MAVSTSSYFSNSIVGQPQLGADIDIYETTSAPKYAVGFGFVRADGNKYRYCHFGAISAVGSVVATDHIESSTTSTAMSAQVLSPTLYTRSGERFAPNKTGARYIQINATGANFTASFPTADVFAGGYLGVVAGSGAGYTYRIKGNTLVGTPASGEFYIDLYDPLQTPIDTTTAFIINGCKYANLEPALALTPAISNAVGFTTVGQTAGYYGWICTRGITSAVLGVGVGTQGNLAIVSTNTAGSIIAHGGTTPLRTEPAFAIVGVIARTYSNSTYCLVDACLE